MPLKTPFNSQHTRMWISEHPESEQQAPFPQGVAQVVPVPWKNRPEPSHTDFSVIVQKPAEGQQAPRNEQFPSRRGQYRYRIQTAFR